MIPIVLQYDLEKPIGKATIVDGQIKVEIKPDYKVKDGMFSNLVPVFELDKNRRGDIKGAKISHFSLNLRAMFSDLTLEELKGY